MLLLCKREYLHFRYKLHQFIVSNFKQQVEAWCADKAAEALRCQKLLVEEEEAAQKRLLFYTERMIIQTSYTIIWFNLELDYL